jgi:hypothetical protein
MFSGNFLSTLPMFSAADVKLGVHDHRRGADDFFLDMAAARCAEEFDMRAATNMPADARNN